MFALAQIEDPRVAEPVVGALHDDDPGVRAAAATGLGKVGGPDAVDPLIAALGDDVVDVRASAAESLGRIADPRAVAALAVALVDDDERLAQMAARSLVSIGSPAVPALAAVLREGRILPRRTAARTLGEIGDPDVVEPLAAALDDEDPGVCQAAAVALAGCGDPRAVEPLVSMLAATPSDVRHAAASSLVGMYQSGRLDAAHQQLILANRSSMTIPHADFTSASDCTDHHDVAGVAFPQTPVPAAPVGTTAPGAPPAPPSAPTILVPPAGPAHGHGEGGRLTQSCRTCGSQIDHFGFTQGDATRCSPGEGSPAGSSAAMQ